MRRPESETRSPLSVHYLSTLRFSDRWLDALRQAAPGVEIRQLTVEDPGQVPADVWAQVDVLHTGSVLPDPRIAPRLRWVQLDTAGIDHLAGHPIWASGAQVTTIGGVSPVPLAEYVIMMVLGVSHRLPDLLEAQRQRDWPSPAERWRRFLPRQVAGSTIVIVGYGRIGREIGRLARALRMEVVGVNRSGAPAGDDVEVVPVSRLASVIGRGDWVVVVTPLTAQTRGLIGAEVLGQLKPGSVLIDVGRGGVVDEDALRRGLDAGRPATAVLDVFAREPLPPSDPLWTHPAVILTPHVSGFAPAYESEVLRLVADNLRRFQSGQPLLNHVDGARGY